MAAPGGGGELTPAVLEGVVGGPERRAIRELPPEVADAIAAGEVIERPASVVKELLENSLDAGARRVTVELEGGGLTLIRVVDDGLGMPPEELGLALRRHATSKLRSAADLARVATLGFRGEALASMAAVARVRLVSREAGSQAGAMVEALAGRVGEVSVTGAPPGTAVEVRDLFFNTPARRNFLRAERTEAQACLRVVAETAMARAWVRFELRAGGRRQLVAPGGGDLLETVRAVVGSGAVAGELRPVSWEDGGIAVEGLLGAPGITFPTRQWLVLMVNGRRVQQRSLLAAAEGAYRGLLAAGRHPLAVLDLRCDPAAVDVNVHPTKREVRFRDERAAFAAVERACWEGLRGAAPARLALVSSGVPPMAQAPAPVSLAGGGPAGIDQVLSEQLPEAAASALSEAAGWRFLGQAHNRYLVVETGSGIALLDQHAAHEKVIYARVRRSLDSGAAAPIPSQGLLEPLLLEIGPEALAHLDASQELLQRAGFEVSPFGEGTVRCLAAPLGARLSELGQLLLEVLADDSSVGDRASWRRHRVAAAVACHSAVRFGDAVDAVEVAQLLSDLSRTEGGITCPHGRPALLLIMEGELLSAFRRHR